MSYQPCFVKKFLLGFLCLMIGSTCFGQIHYIDQLKTKLLHTSDSIEYVNIQILLSKEYTFRKLDSSFYFASKALETSNRLNYQYGKAEAQSVLASHFMDMGNPYMAYLHINRAMDIYEDLKDHKNLANIYKNLAILFMREGNFEQSQKSFEAAIKMVEKLPNDSLNASIYYNYASLKFYMDPYKQVHDYFVKAAEINDRHPDERLTFIIKQALINLKSFHNFPHEEILRDQRDLLVSIQKNDLFEYKYAISLFELGIAYIPSQIDSAIKNIEAGISFAQNNGNEYLHFLFARKGLDHLALHHPNSPYIPEFQKRVQDLSQQFSKSIEDYKMDFFQLALREKDLEIEATHLRERQNMMYLYIGASIILLGLLFGLFMIYRNKRKMAQDLQVLNAQLENKNALLVENNEFHQQLIAILTHDLRQPFSSILMLNQGSLVDNMDKEGLQFAIEQIETSAQTGLQIMDGVLHWMKLQVLGMEFQPNMVSVTESIKESILFNEKQIKDKQIKVNCLIECDVLVAAQNEILLFVNRNIIQNAVRHMPMGGELTFTMEVCDNGRVNIHITDTGPGIPKDLLPILFKKERFNARKPAKSGSKGAGIALVICWEMLHRMGGTLEAKNRPEGGAIFTYQLPLLSQSQYKHSLQEAHN
jgi:signal transduction histidine kinase